MAKSDAVERFGEWSVLAKPAGRKWLCRCSCGTERMVVRVDLRNGKSTNCGCVRRRTMPAAAKAANRVHGMHASTEFRIWTDMRRRCTLPHRPDYKNYGGRGITVCAEWLESFEAFYRDMGPRPEGHSLDRKDNDGPYSKENCVWSTAKHQSRNSRRNVRYDFFGEMLTLPEAAERYGINVKTLRGRIHTGGWSPNDAATQPLRDAA